MSNLAKSILLSLIAAAIASAQGSDPGTTPTGPISGLFVDQSNHMIRRVVGMPGAAYADVPSVDAFDFASAAPNGADAVVSKGGALSLVQRLDSSLPVWIELTGEEGAVSQAWWSEDSGALAVLNSDANRLDLWSGLAGQPRQSGSIDLSGLGESLVSLAIDKDAQFAFAATQGDSSATLFLLKPGAAPQMLLNLTQAGALRLSEKTLFVADRGANAVFSVAGWDQSPAIATIADASNGVADPVGLAVSPDGTHLFVASSRSRQLLAIDLSSNAVANAVDLNFAPEGLDHLGHGSLFVLARAVAGHQPAQVFDASSQRVFFVPMSDLSTLQ